MGTRQFRHDLRLSGRASELKREAVEIYTDAAVVAAPNSNARVGLAWVATTGHWGCMRHAYPRAYSGANAVLIAELRAMAFAWRHVDPRGAVRLRSDSRSAVGWMKRWCDGDPALPPGYQATWRGGTDADKELVPPILVAFAEMLRAYPFGIKISWVPGHDGHPLNEAADSLALMTRRGDLDDAELATAAARIAQVRLEDYQTWKAGGL